MHPRKTRQNYFLQGHALEDNLSKENRNLLANYLSAIDTNTITIDRPKTAPPSKPFVEPSKPTTKYVATSLQEALYMKRPDFIQKSELRVEFLNKIKEQRILHAEKYKQWIEHVAQAKTSSTYPLPPPPEMPKLPRYIFNSFTFSSYFQ